jgi:hypothetical protein
VKPSPTPLPSVPCIHDDSVNIDTRSDFFGGSPLGLQSVEPHFTVGNLQASNLVTAIYYRVLNYNQSPRGPPGDEMDMRIRDDLLLQVTGLEISLPPHLRYNENVAPTPAMIYAKYTTQPLPDKSTVTAY